MCEGSERVRDRFAYQGRVFLGGLGGGCNKGNKKEKLGKINVG